MALLLIPDPRKPRAGSGFLFGGSVLFERAQQPKDNFAIHAANRSTGRFFKLLTQILIETERPGKWSTNIAFGSA
jgi:hypothetical protein